MEYTQGGHSLDYMYWKLSQISTMKTERSRASYISLQLRPEVPLYTRFDILMQKVASNG